jgi:hypothetical protein
MARDWKIGHSQTFAEYFDEEKDAKGWAKQNTLCMACCSVPKCLALPIKANYLGLQMYCCCLLDTQATRVFQCKEACIFCQLDPEADRYEVNVDSNWCLNMFVRKPNLNIPGPESKRLLGYMINDVNHGRNSAEGYHRPQKGHALELENLWLVLRNAAWLKDPNVVVDGKTYDLTRLKTVLTKMLWRDPSRRFTLGTNTVISSYYHTKGFGEGAKISIDGEPFMEAGKAMSGLVADVIKTGVTRIGTKSSPGHVKTRYGELWRDMTRFGDKKGEGDGARPPPPQSSTETPEGQGMDEGDDAQAPPPPSMETSEGQGMDEGDGAQAPPLKMEILLDPNETSFLEDVKAYLKYKQQTNKAGTFTQQFLKSATVTKEGDIKVAKNSIDKTDPTKALAFIESLPEADHAGNKGKRLWAMLYSLAIARAAQSHSPVVVIRKCAKGPDGKYRPDYGLGQDFEMDMLERRRNLDEVRAFRRSLPIQPRTPTRSLSPTSPVLPMRRDASAGLCYRSMHLLGASCAIRS